MNLFLSWMARQVYKKIGNNLLNISIISFFVVIWPISPIFLKNRFVPKKNFNGKKFRPKKISIFWSPIFWKKRLCPWKKFNGKKFSKSIFSFHNTFWTVLNRFRPKTFFRKIFDFLSPIFWKTPMSLKKFSTGKIFKIDIFDLKHVLNHSKSIPTKKIFEKFSIFGNFLPFLVPKKRFFEFLGGKILIFFSFISKGLYCGHFARHVWLSMPKNLSVRSNAQ